MYTRAYMVMKVNKLEDDHNIIFYFFFSMGFAINNSFNWEGIELQPKETLESALSKRFSGRIGTDCIVNIGDVASFECHLMLLQNYSKFFERKTCLEPIVLPEDVISADTFELVYRWMVDVRGDSYKIISRPVLIKVLIAAKFLEIPGKRESTLPLVYGLFTKLDST